MQRLVHAVIRNLIAFQSSYLVLHVFTSEKQEQNSPVFVCRVQMAGSTEACARKHVPRTEIGIKSHTVGSSEGRHR